MRAHMSKFLLIASMAFCLLQLEMRQHEYYDSPYAYTKYPYSNNPPPEISDEAATVIAIIIIIAFIVGIGVACYYCCNALRSRFSNTREQVGGQQPFNQYSPPLPYNPVQPAYPYNVQPNYIRPGPNMPVQMGTPVGINPVNPINPPNSFGSVSDRERLNSACDSCSTRYKLGEEPRAMLSCQSKHLFHLSCLAQAFKFQTDLTCPQCKAPISATFKLFCVSCKVSNANVSFSEFRHQTEGLDIEAIKRQFGECCPSCRGV